MEPKLLTVLREGYSLKQLPRDVVAGIIVGIVALPLAIAFAIASGVKPEQGLYTAVVAGFLISVLGGSRVQIGGPTGAFIVIVYGIVQEFGYDGLAIATIMAGFLLVLMGFARLGTVIKFVPYPVIVGFTSGIALLIAASQVRDFLGLTMASVPADFVEKIAAYSRDIGTLNPWAGGIGVLTAAIVFLWPKVTRKIPGSLVAILVATALVQIFKLPAETIGDRFGSVPNSLPMPHIPAVSWARIQELSPAAATIALLAAIESLLSALVADGMTGTRHRSNMELVAQGVANMVTPLFGGIPATGAIARTAMNIKSGGRTPVAGIVHAITLLMIMLFFARWAVLIPMAALAGILVYVAWNMSEWRNFVRLFRSPRSDVLVLVTTFLLTVLVDLTVALEVGMVMAAFLFMHRMAELSEAGYMKRMMSEDEGPADGTSILSRDIPHGVEVFEVYGTLFFGAASKFTDALHRVEKTPRVLILRLREVMAIDATGLHALEDLEAKTRRDGTVLILSGVHAQPLNALTKAGLMDRIGDEHLAGDIDEALEMARGIIGGLDLSRDATLKPETEE